MRHLNRQRHQLGSLVACVAEHQTLVAGTTGIHTHRDMRALPLDHVQYATGIAVIAKGCIVKADLFDHFAGEIRYFDIGLGGDFTGDNAKPGRNHNFASHTAHRVVFQYGVEHRIRNLICHFVGMTFCHRFRRENPLHCLSH